MQFKYPLIAIVCMAALVAVIPANSASIGPASDYNVFVFGNFTSIGGPDTQGNLAAGGDVTISSYGVATQISGSDARLVADGTVTASNGGVGDGQNGTIYASSTNLSGFTAKGGIYSQTLVDFAAAETFYQNLSTTWSGLSGTTGTSSGSTLTLAGSDTSLNVFSVDWSVLKDVVDLQINAPSSSTVLINVSGNGQTFSGGNVTLSGGIQSNHIIYNFFETTLLALNGGKNLMGSVLAPGADVTGDWGALDGQLIAQSFSGNTEFHNKMFDGEITVVPVPAAIWLFGSAFGFIAVRLGRRGTV